MFCKWKVMMCLEDMYIIVLALVEHKEVPYNKLIKLLDFLKSQMLSSSFWWHKCCFELFAKESFEDCFIFVENFFDYRTFSFYWHRMQLFPNNFKKWSFVGQRQCLLISRQDMSDMIMHMASLVCFLNEKWIWRWSD